jgi:hypothetical protein
VGTASSKEEALIGKEARPWRELCGWLLRSAREPDPWRLGSRRTAEGKGAGQIGRERLGLITQWSGIRTEPGRSRRWFHPRACGHREDGVRPAGFGQQRILRRGDLRKNRALVALLPRAPCGLLREEEGADNVPPPGRGVRVSVEVLHEAAR